MSDMLPAARGPGRPPRQLPRPKLNMPGRSKAAVLLVSLGPERAASVFKHLKEEEIEAALPRDGEDPAGPDGHERGRMERARRDRHGRGLRRRGRRRLRPRGARALGRPGPRRRADRPPVGDDRAPAVRVPAPLLARADLRLPAQRGAADDRRRHREPAHRPRRRGALAAAARAAGRGRAARRHDDRDQPGRHARRRGGPAPEALERRHPRVLLGGRRPVAGRHPQQLRPHDRAQRARLAGRALRRAGRRGPDAPLHLRGHRQARRPQHPARAQGRRRQGSRRSRSAAVNEETQGPDLLQHVRARRRDAPRGDGVPAGAEAQRRRGGPGPHRRRRSAASRSPARSSSAAAAAKRTRCSDAGPSSSISSSPRPTSPTSATSSPSSSRARAEADAIREAARAEGFAAGQAEGAAAAQAMAQAQLVPAVQALPPPPRRSPPSAARSPTRSRPRAVELALELAEKVVAGAIAAQPERVLDVVRGALRCFVERERVQSS